MPNAPTPADRKYAESHEWHLVQGDVVTIGITEHAVDQLTDITFVEMKPVGTSMGAGDTVGEVESVKTTSDIYSGVAGEIIEVNTALSDSPELINSDPYGKGWLVKIKVSDASGLAGLMDAAAYDKSIA
ncbi:glycine cleavage system protein GcvH [Nodularia spumigena]|jgi:glycine cleavage system H protein|uniref:glycine cleavage system protein GcvH n=1 Tax=Nodularia spumigena TaxID=70799 RepID=UPI002B1EE012|nr:glycine cleavage system protein GcvH [Nodularia spumigena]MEA5611816.1 glycine cleavage system protein GcvH [Nodularia spumigena UHCC 0040]